MISYLNGKWLKDTYHFLWEIVIDKFIELLRDIFRYFNKCQFRSNILSWLFIKKKILNIFFCCNTSATPPLLYCVHKQNIHKQLQRLLDKKIQGGQRHGILRNVLRSFQKLLALISKKQKMSTTVLQHIES